LCFFVRLLYSSGFMSMGPSEAAKALR
jgi:hypothetical protein